MIDVESASERVAVVRLRHGKVNALDVELLDALVATLRDVETSAAAVVLTGNGRVFSAGADLTRVLDGGADYIDRFISALHDAFSTLFSFPRPVVAAVDGAAIAGGCVIAAACDHRVMADSPARIGATELVVGVPFPVSAIEIVRHSCGHRTDDLALRARLLDVAEALEVGLIHEAVPAPELLDRAVAVATELAGLPGEAYAMAKRQLRAGALDRIERDAPARDAVVRRIWASDETAGRLRAQLERLRDSRRT